MLSFRLTIVRQKKTQKTIFHHAITLTHIIHPLQKEKIAHVVQKIFAKECTQGIPLDNKLLTQLLYEKKQVYIAGSMEV